MNTAPKSFFAPELFRVHWRYVLTAVVVVGSFGLMLLLAPFGQNPDYHNFADRRAFFGIPNFFDVVSNPVFLFVGIAGLNVCFRNHLGNARNAWIVLFAGVTLVGVGSAYYHWNPNNQTLVWDRLPMTIGFMGLFVAMLGEYVNERFNAFLVPAILLGLSSVIYWRWSDDLRFYYWVQLISLLIIPLVMILYRAKYSHQWLLLASLGWYALAKISELYDGKIFTLSQGLVSGHTVKHLLSALGCLTIVLMLRRRMLLEP